MIGTLDFKRLAEIAGTRELLDNLPTDKLPQDDWLVLDQLFPIDAENTALLDVCKFLVKIVEPSIVVRKSQHVQLCMPKDGDQWR